jgi:tripartite ATP-independent transporter DctP family solute receptor
MALLIGAALFMTSCQKKAPTQAAAPAQKVTLSISHIVNEQNSWHKASVFFKDQVEKASGGRIEVKIYPNSSVGTELDGINSIVSNAGDVDIIFTGESLGSVIPELTLLGVPYMISGYDHLKKVAEGPIGAGLEKLMIEKANMRVLGYYTRGPRDITANKPIRTVADLKGFNIRVPASPMHVAAWEALGAKTTPMAFAEVFTALQQHTIDGQENPLAMIQSGNFYEVQKYLCKSEHLISWVYIVINEAKFQSLPKDLQDIIVKAGKDMQAYENKLFLEDELTLEKFMTDHGMTVISDVDKASLASQMRVGLDPVIQKQYPAVWPLYQQVLQLK